MKKILLALTGLIIAGLALQAQTMYDALDLGKDNYYGTARTMGMGNAVTAVGSDLGTIGLNPAGSAVAGYSQFALTQGLAISSTVSSWAPGYSEFDGSQDFSGRTQAGKTRYIMPNVGFNMRVETGESSGLKSWNFAFLSQMTNNFLDNAYARGYNAVGDNPRYTSMSGALAVGAQFNSDGNGSMLNPDILMLNAPYDTPNSRGFYDHWQYITAYQGGMINYNETLETGGAFYGATEYKDGPFYLLDDNGNKIQLTDDDGNPLVYADGPEAGQPVYAQTYDFATAGPLRQTSNRVRTGSKNDIVTNFGMNFNDKFYLGFNLNVPLINYRYKELFTESVDNNWPTWGTITPEMVTADGQYVVSAEQYLRTASYEYNYTASVAGISAGMGFIWLPTRNLRIGAAIKTPTAYTVSERLYMMVDTRYDNITRHGQSPIGEFEYNFRSPWSWNAGLAYTIGSLGMVSVDYHMTDFSVMKYSTGDDFSPENPYEFTNELMGLFCGVSNSWRFGMELRPLPFLAVRAGFSTTSNPERYYDDSDGYVCDAALYEKDYNYYQAGNAWFVKKHYVKAPVNTVSLGLGFVSTGSFFADLAVRRTTSASYYSPYVTYAEATDATGNVIADENGNSYMVISPCTRAVRSLFDAILTIGWRF